MEFIKGSVSKAVVIVLIIAQCKGVDYKSVYRRVPENYLKAIPQKVFENATVEKCAANCVMETEFECKSFDIDNLNRECHLHNHTHTEPLVGLQHALGFDHYRTAYERLFSRIPNHVITLRHNRIIRGLTVEECARRCILEITFKCLGFDYEERRRNCWLTDKNVHEVNGLMRRTNIDFYERKSNGPLGKFINYGFGSLQTLEGVQTHGKIVLGVHLDACAQLCLAETSFLCASFDYVHEEQSCQLSQYIAANVHGIRTEYDSKYQVMHYELIGEYLEYFYPTPYASLLGNNDRTIWKVTPETCARKCLEEREFVCRSFDYQIQKGTCLLSHVTGSDAGGLYTPEGVNVHHFEMKPSLDCGGILKEDRGTFASPNWPRHYLHHLNCTWMVEVPSFRIIQFEIYHLDLGWQTDEPCSHDNDVLSISETTSKGKFTRICLTNYQTQISTTTNKAEVSFVTNSENDAQGFRIFYFADWPCKTTLTKDNGEFASPRWPNSYQAMTSCHWHIQGPVNTKVMLRFSSIELEDHTGSSCLTAYDKIKIYDSFTASNHLNTLCGNRRSTSFTSTENSLYVVFTTDSRVQAKGFHASYTFVFPSTTTTRTQTTTTTTTTKPTSSTRIITNSQSLQTNLNVTKENATFNMSLDDLTRPEKDSSNVSVSMKLAMISNDEEVNEKIELLAVFVEPLSENSDKINVNTSVSGEGNPSDDIGREERPAINFDVVHISKDFNAIILGVFASLVALLCVFSIVVMLVCRYYRRRLPKIRQGTNMHAPEENLSLCRNNGQKVIQQDEFKDEDDVNDAARLPLPSDHAPVPDIEFHNPLYNDHVISGINLSIADGIQTINDTTSAFSQADDQTSVNNACASEILNTSDNESDIERTELISNLEEDSSSPCLVTSANDVIQKTVYIDCLTTL